MATQGRQTRRGGAAALAVAAAAPAREEVAGWDVPDSIIEASMLLCAAGDDPRDAGALLLVWYARCAVLAGGACACAPASSCYSGALPPLGARTP
jgi:hypothetical protein